MKTEQLYPYDYWHRVFMRMFHKSISSETLHAAYPGIMQKLERHCLDGGKMWIERALDSEQSAYDFFIDLFSRLSPSEQKAATGKTVYEWLEAEKQYRRNAGVVC